MRAVLCVLAAAFAVSCQAFAPASLGGARSAAVRSHVRPALSMVEKVDAEIISPQKKAVLEAKKNEILDKKNELVDSAKDVADSIKGAFKDIDAQTLSDDFSAAVEGIKNNFKSGKVGERGEVAALVPYILVFFLLTGDLPFFGDTLEFVAGPGLLIFGVSLYVASIIGLGKNLSPWQVPCENNVLKTTGAYSLCRHPMYTGIVAGGLGLGFATDSFVRLAISGVLLYVLDRKAAKEEEALAAIHPAYKTYKEEVPKFIPIPGGIDLKLPSNK